MLAMAGDGTTSRGAGGAAAAEPPSYEIVKSAPPATVGSPSNASIGAVALNGWSVSAEMPITLSVKADRGLALVKTTLVRADLVALSKDRFRFDVDFAVASAGRKLITADASFVVCRDNTCKLVRETVVVEVEASPPPPPLKRPRARSAKPKG